MVRAGTASESCFAFLSLRAPENEGLAGEAKESDEGEERADAEDGSRRGGDLAPFFRGDILNAGRSLFDAILERPAVASERAGLRGSSLSSSSLTEVCKLRRSGI